ncbi:CobW family GTP-binding protein [bacterium 210820-DFI.6.37]|nr:CobW family GTP-binding protein [bacterium 210820-DFI.6.37]
MIKLVLLTGFLGAGKTTLMKEILNSYGDMKTGVIVNEFGEINIDAKLISKDGIKMAELSNGSIFCACIKDKFVDSLIEMSLQDLDYLFIEASGMADPANMNQILEGIKNKVLNSYDYRGSICVIDGESFADLYELLPAITAQLEFCGGAIINKGDLIDEKQLKKILDIIDEVNQDISVFVTSYCKVNVKELVEGLKKNTVEARESSNRAETRPTTFILKGLRQVPYDRLIMFLNEIAKHTYRMKGFADTDKGNIEISTVGNNIHLNEWPNAVDNTEIVVISSVGFKMMSILTRSIAEHLKGFIRL